MGSGMRNLEEAIVHSLAIKLVLAPQTSGRHSYLGFVTSRVRSDLLPDTVLSQTVSGGEANYVRKSPSQAASTALSSQELDDKR